MTPEFKAPPKASSNIQELAHHDGTLYVKFHNGSCWKYSDVDAKLYGDMLAADSVGKFFNAFIRKVKPGERHELQASAAAR